MTLALKHLWGKGSTSPPIAVSKLKNSLIICQNRLHAPVQKVFLLPVLVVTVRARGGHLIRRIEYSILIPGLPRLVDDHSDITESLGPHLPVFRLYRRVFAIHALSWNGEQVRKL